LLWFITKVEGKESGGGGRWTDFWSLWIFREEDGEEEDDEEEEEFNLLLLTKGLKGYGFGFGVNEVDGNGDDGGNGNGNGDEEGDDGKKVDFEEGEL